MFNKNLKKFVLFSILSTFSFISFCTITGCVYRTPNKIARILEVPNRDYVKSCQLVGQVVGDSPYPILDVGVQIAKDKAKRQAAKLGATHITWEEVSSSGAPIAVGRAYRCKKGV